MVLRIQHLKNLFKICRNRIADVPLQIQNIRLYLQQTCNKTNQWQTLNEIEVKPFPLNDLLLLRLPSNFSGLHTTLQIAYNIEVQDS